MPPVVMLCSPISLLTESTETSRRGLILINTGPGKGNANAALGTAFRAAENGMRVLILQFLKGSWHYGELDAADALGHAFNASGITDFVIKQMGRGFVKVGGAETDPEDIRMVEDAWAETAAILSGDWDLVVLDEINYALGYRMLDAQKVADVLRQRPEMVHVILTGRNAHPILVELAYTVTEMREVKHTYEKHPRPARHRALSRPARRTTTPCASPSRGRAPNEHTLRSTVHPIRATLLLSLALSG